VQVPPALPYKTKRYPALVLLHTWSHDLEERFPTAEAESDARGWLLVQPNFRGRNDRPEACGSPLAQQDVLDAVEWVKGHYPVDDTRIYLLGFSGGAFMTLLMVSRHPEPWAAASAWGGISDVTQWYREHGGDDYGRMLRACLGGNPLESATSAAEASARSPLTYLSASLQVPLDPRRWD
jgi:dipeptidyl aminopeptidase/acylaminoacyl peptidase